MSDLSVELDSNSSVPLYRQIKKILLNEIFSGELDPQVPMTEAQLLKRFGVSRAPIRQALGELAEEGYVYRRQGLGTFPIAGAQVERPPEFRAGGLHKLLAKKGLNPSSKVLGIERVTAPESIRQLLGVGSAQELLHYHQISTMDNKPLAASELFIVSPPTFRPTQQQLEHSGSVFEMLAKHTGVTLKRSDHETWASKATAVPARMLEIPEGSSVLYIDSVFFTEDGTAVGWRRAIHIADSFRYRFSEIHN